MQARRLPPQSFVMSTDVETSLNISVMKKVGRSFAFLFAFALSLFAADKPEEKLKPALDVITPDALLAHIKILSSDEFECRSPVSKAEELSIKYIADLCRSIVLMHENPYGS